MNPDQCTRGCGFIDVAGLDALDSRREDGWIRDPSLLVAMSRQLLALAKGRTVTIVGWEGSQSEAPPPVSITLPLREDYHRITAIQWLIFRGLSVLVLGTTQGSVLFYSRAGTLLLRQVFQGTPVLQLRVRGRHSRPSKSNKHHCVEELCVVHSKAIVRIDRSDLQPLLSRCLHDAEERSRKGKGHMIDEVYFSSHRLAHEVWNTSRNTAGTSICVDGVITGVMAPPLLEHQSRQRYFCAITVGPGCTLAAHRLVEDKTSTIKNIIMRRIVPATLSTIAALTRVFWPNTDQQQAASFSPLEIKPQEFGRGSLVTSLKDHPRKGERIALSPSGTLAAVTDSLGRIHLVDTQALVVIRLWKGYRDAFCFFLEVPVSNNVASEYRRPRNQTMSKQGLFLCLAIHAPRRGLIEIWKLRYGPRILLVKCGSDCRVLQPACEFGGSENNMENQYIPAEVYILNGRSGRLAVISPRICA